MSSYRLYGDHGVVSRRGHTGSLGGNLFAILPTQYRPVVGLSAFEIDVDHSYMVDIGSTRNTFQKPKEKPALFAKKPRHERHERHDAAASAAFFRYG